MPCFWRNCFYTAHYLYIARGYGRAHDTGSFGDDILADEQSGSAFCTIHRFACLMPWDCQSTTTITLEVYATWRRISQRTHHWSPLSDGRSFERKDVEIASFGTPGSPRVPLGGCGLARIYQIRRRRQVTRTKRNGWTSQASLRDFVRGSPTGRKSDTAQKQRQCRVNTTSLSHHLITSNIHPA
jgi:hypothetical protein